jgi:hypothetical protein
LAAGVMALLEVRGETAVSIVILHGLRSRPVPCWNRLPPF